MRKISVVVILVLLLSITLTANAEGSVYSGLCGANTTYNLNTETGILYLSGAGRIVNYKSVSDLPWYPYRDKIRTIIIGDGVICPMQYLNLDDYGGD